MLLNLERHLKELAVQALHLHALISGMDITKFWAFTDKIWTALFQDDDTTLINFNNRNWVHKFELMPGLK